MMCCIFNVHVIGIFRSISHRKCFDEFSVFCECCISVDRSLSNKYRCIKIVCWLVELSEPNKFDECQCFLWPIEMYWHTKEAQNATLVNNPQIQTQLTTHTHTFYMHTYCLLNEMVTHLISAKTTLIRTHIVCKTYVVLRLWVQF